MGAKTGIEWTDATWNPIIGCSRVSEGCRNCYAEGIAGRFGGGKSVGDRKATVYDGLTRIVNNRAVWTGEIKETRQLLQPLSWKPGRPIYDASAGKKVGRDQTQSLRVFVNSMSDLFHENVTDELRDRIFAVMALCPQHTFQVLTKRPERMRKYLTGSPWGGIVVQAAKIVADYRRIFLADAAANVAFHFNFIPLPNVWLGVSVENQATADERIPLLLQTPAAVRFISAEPLLGAVDLSCIAWPDDFPHAVDGPGSDGFDALRFDDRNSWARMAHLDWAICGGESGPHARPMHPDWARGLRDQCKAASVPFFFKQWGEWWPKKPEENLGLLRARPNMKSHDWNGGVSSWKIGKHAAGALLDGVEHREFPTAAAEAQPCR